MSAVILADQPLGAGPGVAGKGRNDLWLSREIVLTETGVGNTTWAWTLMRRPHGSAAALAGAATQSATFTPDVKGTYRVRVVTDAGLATEDTSYKVFRVRYSNTGVLVDRGYVLPAVDEVDGESNYDIDRGYGSQVNDLEWGEPLDYFMSDVHGRLTTIEGGSGGGFTQEEIEDILGGSTLQTSSTIALTYDDGANTISFGVVPASISATQLAADAVTTVKILDANVTLGKLANITGPAAIGSLSAGSVVPGLVPISQDGDANALVATNASSRFDGVAGWNRTGDISIIPTGLFEVEGGTFSLTATDGNGLLSAQSDLTLQAVGNIVMVAGGVIDCGNARVTSVADPTAATDALNLQSAEARGLAIVRNATVPADDAAAWAQAGLDIEVPEGAGTTTYVALDVQVKVPSFTTGSGEATATSAIRTLLTTVHAAVIRDAANALTVRIKDATAAAAGYWTLIHDAGGVLGVVPDAGVLLRLVDSGTGFGVELERANATNANQNVDYAVEVGVRFLTAQAYAGSSGSPETVEFLALDGEAGGGIEDEADLRAVTATLTTSMPMNGQSLSNCAGVTKASGTLGIDAGTGTIDLDAGGAKFSVQDLGGGLAGLVSTNGAYVRATSAGNAQLNSQNGTAEVTGGVDVNITAVTNAVNINANGTVGIYSNASSVTVGCLGFLQLDSGGTYDFRRWGVGIPRLLFRIPAAVGTASASRAVLATIPIPTGPMRRIRASVKGWPAGAAGGAWTVDVHAENVGGTVTKFAETIALVTGTQNLGTIDATVSGTDITIGVTPASASARTWHVNDLGDL